MATTKIISYSDSQALYTSPLSGKASDSFSVLGNNVTVLPNNYSADNLDSGFSPYGYISSCASNLNIKIYDRGADDDIQILTADGEHVYGGTLSNDYISQLFKLDNDGFSINGFNKNATYNNSDMIDASKASDKSSDSGYGVTVYTELADNNPTQTTNPTSWYEDITISTIPETLIVVFTGGGHYDINNISYTVNGSPTYKIKITNDPDPTKNGALVDTLIGKYGTLTITDASKGAYTFTPDSTKIKALNKNDDDDFTVVATYGGSCQSVDNKVEINITAVDDKPTKVDGGSGTVYENAPGKQSTLLTALNITDPDGYTPAQTTYNGTYGTVTLKDPNNDGQWDWFYTLNAGVTLLAGMNGIAQDTITLSDLTDKSGNPLKITIDIDKAPTVSITSPSDNSDMKAVVSNDNITFEFSEKITDFTSDDIIVIVKDNNGAVVPTSNLITNLNSPLGSDQGKIWKATFTPIAGLPAGSTATIQVKDKSYKDNVLNEGSASNILTLNLDTQAPTVTVTAMPTSLTAGQTAVITFKFSEPVNGFDMADIVYTGGTLTNLQNPSGDKTTYTATFMASSGSNATISVHNQSYTDELGNKGSAGSATISLDTKAPTLEITTSDSCLKIGETATITFDFDEEVTGFTLSDAQLMTAGVGALSAFAQDAVDKTNAHDGHQGGLTRISQATHEKLIFPVF